MIEFLVCEVLAFLTLLSEATWLHSLSFAGVIPNLSLIFCVTCGILTGQDRGGILGFSIGLMTDLLFRHVVGYYAAVYFLIAFASGYFYKDYHKSNLVLPIYLVILFDLSYGFLQYLILRFFARDLGLTYYIVHLILPETCYTAIVTSVFYPLGRALSRFIRFLGQKISTRKALA